MEQYLGDAIDLYRLDVFNSIEEVKAWFSDENLKKLFGREHIRTELDDRVMVESIERWKRWKKQPPMSERHFEVHYYRARCPHCRVALSDADDWTLDGGVRNCEKCGEMFTWSRQSVTVYTTCTLNTSKVSETNNDMTS